MPRSKSPTPTCPRCAYDQSGAIATWTDSCPLHGTCPECGLPFQWCDVLRPHFRRLPWLYEHARGLAPRALALSLVRTAFPWRFWSQVQLAHRIAPARLLLMLVLTLVTMHLAAVVVRFAGKVLYTRHSFQFHSPGDFTPTDWPTTFGTAADHGHIAFLLVPFGPLHRDFSEALDALVGLPSRWLILLHILAAILLLVLPHTRAIAKVRAIHLVRAAAYPIVLIIALFYFGVTLECACHSIGLTSRNRLWWMMPHWAELIVIPFGVLYALWWWRLVCTRYLKLPSPNLVWAITMGVALFGTIVLPPVNAAIIHELLFGY